MQKYINVEGKEDLSILEYAFLNSYYSTGMKNLVDKAVITYGIQHKIKEQVVDYEKIDEIPCEKLPFWIVCIVKNEAVTILRKNQRTVQLENWDSFAADAESVTDYLELVQLFSRLPETYRAVLEMRLLLGYTGKEIARHLALSESAVNTRIFRGRALLREIAEKEAFYV